jgi:hypothetical protein
MYVLFIITTGLFYSYFNLTVISMIYQTSQLIVIALASCTKLVQMSARASTVLAGLSCFLNSRIVPQVKSWYHSSQSRTCIMFHCVRK